MHRIHVGFLALAVAVVVALVPAVSSGTAAPRVVRPHAVKLLFNGKQMTTYPINSDVDTYQPIPAGDLKIEATWATNAAHSGYYVAIATSEPEVRTFAKCTTGTSCRVPGTLHIYVDQEVSWNVKVIRTRGNKLVEGFRVCLEGAVHK